MDHAKVLWDLYRLKRNEKRSPAQMNAMQDKKLRRLLHYAWEHSGYYHHAFAEAGITKDQISKLPLQAFPPIDKGILMEHFDELVTVPGLKQAELRKFDEDISLRSR